jgi:MFS family permease
MQLFAVLFFAICSISALIADKMGRRKRWFMLLLQSVLDFHFLFSKFRQSVWFTFFYMALMGFTYGPLGTFLSELFPTTVRYSGASLTFNLGILGAAFCSNDCNLVSKYLWFDVCWILFDCSSLYFVVCFDGN